MMTGGSPIDTGAQASLGGSSTGSRVDAAVDISAIEAGPRRSMAWGQSDPIMCQ